MKRRILSIITALALCLSLCPTWALAAEADPSLCKHHLAHTADCGYAAPTEGHDCGHEHTEDCYAEETRCVHVHDESCYSDGLLPAEGEDKAADACTHTCTAESGCVTRTLDCRHSHDSECGYIAPTEGVPCGYVCRICPIEDLIAALPRRVTEDNRADVEAQLQKILALFAELPEDQQELVDISRCLELQEALDEASVSMPLADSFTMNSDITINSGNANQYNGKTLTGTSNSEYTLTIDGATVNLTISGLNFTGGNAGTIVLKNGATLNLTLQGSNRLVGGGSTAGITVPAGCSLTIKGTDADSLDVLGGSGGGAGIGANYYPFNTEPGSNTVGTITINGGKITATGYGGGAGIGGTYRCHTGHVVINGGTVTAIGTLGSLVLYAAGIGGGSCGYLESIIINGGTVTAAGVDGCSAGIGAGYFNTDRPHGNTVSCGDIQINGGTVKDTVIGYGSTDTQGAGSVTIRENIDLPGCTVRPLPGNFASYTFQGTVYDQSITEDVNAVFSIDGYQREVTIKMLDAALYCGSFTVTIIMPPKASADASLAWGGKTLTAADVPLSDTTSVTFGTQEYQRYSISGTIYDGRITGDMQATVSFSGKSHTVTLKKTSDYCATFRIDNLVAATGAVAEDLSVTVTAGTITWSGTTSSGTNKTLTIGRQLYKTRLIFWDGGITADMSVSQIQVSRNGIPLGAAEAASDNTLHMEQVGKGYLDVWMVPGENTGISVTVLGLNGGVAIEKTGLTIGTDGSEIEMYRGVSTHTPTLDLANGDVIFDGSGGSLSVTYWADGEEKIVTGLSYDALHGVTQSSSGTPAANQIIVRNISQALHLQIGNINLDRNGSAISIEAGCAVELQTRGSNTVASSSMMNPAVYVDPHATLTLSGDGTLTANYTGTNNQNQYAAVIGGKNGNSGKIIIRSGTVTVNVPAAGQDRYGAGIGGGHKGAGDVEIYGGTVTAASSYGAGIGGGDSGSGTVKIYGGIVTANSSTGAGIGGGDKGAGDVEIHGGTVTAKSSNIGSGIGGGSGGVGSVKILGGTVTAEGSNGAGIGGGYKGAGDVEIHGGTVTAAGSYGAGIGGGDSGTGNVKIVGGTVTASSSSSSSTGIGGGRFATDAAVTITGGSINASKVSNPTNGSESVSLVTITLIGVGDQVLVTDVEVEGGYGLHDVYTRDGGKLYFYLPADTRPTTITVGGVDYAPEDVGSTNYARALDVELTGYPLTKVYDGAPMAEPSAGQVTGGAADLTFTWYQDGTAMASAPVNAGSYVLKASSGGANRFFGVTITKRPLTITAQAQTIDYGGSIAQDAYTSSGLAAGDSLTVTLMPSQTEQGTHEKAITVSSVMITRDSADVAGNYDITNNPGTLTIRKAAPTVSSWPTAGEITYGQTLGNSTLAGGSTSTEGTFAWKDGSVKPNAGTAEYDVIFTPTDTNYEPVTRKVSVTVQTATLTVTANDQTITYGGSIQTGAAQVTVTGLVNGDTLTGITVSASAANAGTYAGGIAASGAKIENNGTDVTANYAISYATGKLTINKAPLTIASATIKTRPYQPTNHAAEVSGVTFVGLVNGETLALGTDYSATGEFDSASAGTGKDVTVTVTLADTAKANNYQLSGSTCAATGDVAMADPVVTAVSVRNPDTIYESATLDQITLTHGASDTAGTVTLDAGQTLTVGTKGYAWTFTPDDTANYNTATGKISLTVERDTLQSIAITTAPTKTTYTYGESFDKAGMVITATYASGATKDVTNEVQISPAELTVTTTALTITYQGKTVTQGITVSPMTVSAPTIELSPDTFVYDGAEKKPAVTVKDGTTVIPASEYTVTYSNNINVGTAATVTITDKTGGNYTVNGSTTFTITAKPLTGAKVEVTGTFTYTGNAQEPTPTVTLDGETLTANTDYTVTYDKNTNAGTATITVTGTGNYSGTAQGTFTIGKATLTVDGTGTASGTYGDKLSELTVSGLTAKLGEATVTGTWKLAGGTVPNVGDSGEYTATFTPATGAGNYNALEAQVTLNIAQATAPTPQTGTLNVQNGHAREYTYDLSRLLPVLASGQSFGGEVTYTLKTVNITVAGYYDSDTAAISGTTLTLPVKVVTSSDEGQIGTITVTISSKNFADVDATINVNRVNKQPVSIEGVTAQNGTYNGGTHNGYTGTPTASPYSGGFTVTYAKADGTALSGPPTNAGDYTVTFSLDPNDTYTGSRTLSFTISKASITIKADDKRADVGAAKPALTYTVTGLVSGDTLATAPTLVCDADMNTIGQYPITASGAAVPSGGNYNTTITYVAGTLNVTDPTISVTGVTLNKTSTTLTVGGSERLTATVAPSDATDKSVTWASSNTAVATVDSSGNVTAIDSGSATITVTTADGAKTATCTVTVRTNSSGGGGGGGGGGTTTSPTVTVPVSGDKGTVHVSASVSGTTATVSKIDTTQIENIIGDNGQASMVEIDFTGLGKTIDTVKLPAAAIKDIAAKAQNEEVRGLTVKLPEAEISFDANALSAIQAQAGSQITLTVTPAKPADLNSRQKEAVGSAPVFDLTLRSSSGTITDFRGGYATVSLPYTLAAGQNPSGVVVYYLDSTGNTTPCTTMYDVGRKSAIFTTGHLSLYFVGYDPTAVWVNPFSDVAEGAWYYDAVRYASENGLMGGYGNGKFGPNDNLSRAQFAQILFNKEGRPVVNYLLRYNDVTDGAWYTEAVRWATSQGIVNGYGNGMFGPNDNITREQLAVMLWRYAGSPAATDKELHFTDTDKASSFALEALRWAVENGVMGGYGDGRLDPKGLATRAQVAQMLKNYLEK